MTITKKARLFNSEIQQHLRAIEADCSAAMEVVESPLAQAEAKSFAYGRLLEISSFINDGVEELRIIAKS